MSELATPSVEIVARPLGRPLAFVMAAATGIAVANIYYNQPMLGVMQAAFPGQRAAELIPTATQIGYAAGLFLLVPLGDMMDRRRLIIVQFGLLAVCARTRRHGADRLGVGRSVLCGRHDVDRRSADHSVRGVFGVAGAARPDRRHDHVRTAVRVAVQPHAGRLRRQPCGMARDVLVGGPSGIVAGTRWRVALPRNHPYVAMPYADAMRSMVKLWSSEPTLRSATIAQAALFASFTVFWTILAFHLREPHFSLGADVAGLFGIVGAVGVFAAPMAGRLADRRGPHVIASVGIAITIASWLIFGFWSSLLGLIVGVVVLDFGVTSALISNQHVVFGLHPQARGRINTIFMTGMFLGGSLGSAGATIAWNEGGWIAVSMFGAALALFAAGVHVYARTRQMRPQRTG
jgi:MFS family permease